MGRRKQQDPSADLVKIVFAVIFLLAMILGGGNVLKAAHVAAQLAWVLVFLLVLGGLTAIVYLGVRSHKQPSIRQAAPPRLAEMKPEAVTVPPTIDNRWHPDMRLLNKPPVPSPQPNVIEKLRATDWYQFEKVVGLIYESQGYRLTRRGGANPDGGIDLLIEKDGVLAAVQCKRWKKWKVDVPKVRELIGSMTHEKLPRGVIVALNGFTEEAKQLAATHQIEIVHDETLEGMVNSLTAEDQAKVHAMLDDDTKHCPKCEASMVWRTPKPSQHFTPFWGCSRYPRCYGKLMD
jgi:Holliday junction resolvase-like predicted endonuclease